MSQIVSHHVQEFENKTTHLYSVHTFAIKWADHKRSSQLPALLETSNLDHKNPISKYDVTKKINSVSKKIRKKKDAAQRQANQMVYEEPSKKDANNKTESIDADISEGECYSGA